MSGLQIGGARRCTACGRLLPRDQADEVCSECRALAEHPEAAHQIGGPAATETEAAGVGPSIPAHGGQHGHRIPAGEEPRWIDRAENVRRMIWVFWGVCALVLAVDLLDLAGVLYHKHPHFGWERVPGFYGLYGFVACVALVLLAKQLRKLVMRGEGYYDA